MANVAVQGEPYAGIRPSVTDHRREPAGMPMANTGRASFGLRRFNVVKEIGRPDEEAADRMTLDANENTHILTLDLS